MVPFAPCDKKNEEIPNPASPTRTAKVDSGPTASTLPDRPLVGLCHATAFSSHRKASARLRRKSEGVGLAAFGALSPARTAFSSHRKASARLRRKSEGVGFEPTDPCGSPVFKTGAIDRSTTPPNLYSLAILLGAGKPQPLHAPMDSANDGKGQIKTPPREGRRFYE